MKKMLFTIIGLSVGLFANYDCKAAKFFEFNEKTHKCELRKEANKLLEQLDVRAGLMQSFSADVKQFLCEEQDVEGLKELILNGFKSQDPIYYKEHQNALETYTVDSFIYPGRTKDSVGCPPGFEITGGPCNWQCTKQTVHENLMKR